MNSYINYLTIPQTYGYLWGKYRPAILKLMIASAERPQQYRFSQHEIRALNPKEKSGYAFILRIHRNKAVNNIRSSAIARDLLQVLQQSGKASELAESSIYEFKLDKHFVLHVVREEMPQAIHADLGDVVTEHIEG